MLEKQPKNKTNFNLILHRESSTMGILKKSPEKRADAMPQKEAWWRPSDDCHVIFHRSNGCILLRRIWGEKDLLHQILFSPFRFRSHFFLNEINPQSSLCRERREETRRQLGRREQTTENDGALFFGFSEISEKNTPSQGRGSLLYLHGRRSFAL
ncbi:hypothetical protein NE237_011123 [Protea cynaroides]|uniref:Uncharacterized protein n=1 Tax=Protea cynaroides TaxID=273540 RepID=A0A9Q0GXK6_9MAGN|nr:hypothetical protein NE237_011123 [Protea cynaroides]